MNDFENLVNLISDYIIKNMKENENENKRKQPDKSECQSRI